MKLALIGLTIMFILLLVFVIGIAKGLQHEIKLLKDAMMQSYLKHIAMDHMVDQNNIVAHKRMDKIEEHVGLEE